ncbi:L-fucose:H+ symporter permease [Alteromonas sp. MMG017]|uniref:L-fucose:H+ symporter permease n=1 Tax=Alteromonas sp. MMG017 TaxID=2822692 RepID=UPI001B39EA39|nr:L-fucose:H+ symporter permease [Alteromonas sp. MMG017]MBQ4828497.1 L-fucose:H+ symporter permease [Alteromonas sp. MMG017]
MSSGMEQTAEAVSIQKNQGSKPQILEAKYIVPFLLVASLFPLWGFANDVTNPLVKAFKDIFMISNAQSSLVQFAFYLGYGVMAIPAAIFIRRFSYKSGILLGLGLYAIGASLFVPASIYMEFSYFLAALWILTCGLALLETTANPYVLSMGHPDTSTQRLNLAQAFNPIGSLSGMFVASSYILSELRVEAFREQEKVAHPEYAQMLPSVVDGKLTNALYDFALNNPVEHQTMQAADLITVRGPYVAIAVVVAIMFFVFLLSKLPKTMAQATPLTTSELKNTFQRLFANKCYLEGVIAQAFYVGAQIMCWTFVIHYGMTSVGLSASEAQSYNMVAMGIFLASRFICTFLLGFFRPGQLLMLLALGGFILSLGTIFVGGYTGLYCLIATSACMSLMFPTIYGIALKGMGEDASLASAGLVMAIVGGALMPPMQGSMIDGASLIDGIPSVQTSFVLPLICFAVICLYGYRAHYKYGR